jgi:hypothetical protein
MVWNFLDEFGKQQICSAVLGNLSTVCRIGSPAKKSLPPFLDVQMQVGA